MKHLNKKRAMEKINDYLDNNSWDKFYEMWEIDDIIEGYAPSDIVNTLEVGFDARKPYIRYTEKGTLQSYTFEEVLKVSKNRLGIDV